MIKIGIFYLCIGHLLNSYSRSLNKSRCVQQEKLAIHSRFSAGLLTVNSGRCAFEFQRFPSIFESPIRLKILQLSFFSVFSWYSLVLQQPKSREVARLEDFSKWVAGIPNMMTTKRRFSVLVSVKALVFIL